MQSNPYRTPQTPPAPPDEPPRGSIAGQNAVLVGLFVLCGGLLGAAAGWWFSHWDSIGTEKIPVVWTVFGLTVGVSAGAVAGGFVAMARAMSRFDAVRRSRAARRAAERTTRRDVDDWEESGSARAADRNRQAND